MASRLTGRRSTTAAGIYVSALLGFLATVVAARLLGVDEFALFAIVLAAVGLLQTLLDLTVEEALTKYGFRFVTAGEWGKLRRLFRRALAVKLAGAVLAGIALLVLAPFADALFSAEGLAVPLAVAALLPLAQAPEGPAATALILHGRTDVRGAFLALSMALRFGGIAVGASYGVTEAVIGIVVAQVVATACVGAAGLARVPPLPERRPRRRSSRRAGSCAASSSARASRPASSRSAPRSRRSSSASSRRPSRSACSAPRSSRSRGSARCRRPCG